jgi:site-specific DNA-methyltransferase (adenine-specific)
MSYELHNGDCLEFMRSMLDRSVDHVITDPPYDEETHIGKRSHGATESDITFEHLSSMDWLKEALRVSRGWVIAFCSLEQFAEYRAAAGSLYIRGGAWHRTNSAPQFTGDRPAQSCEGIAIMHAEGHHMKWNGGGRQAFWETPIEQGERYHPTQKPIRLMQWLVSDFTNKGELILDPFCGSGTTGVACLNTERLFIGCEMNETYFEAAQKRLKQAQDCHQTDMIGYGGDES